MPSDRSDASSLSSAGSDDEVHSFNAAPVQLQETNQPPKANFLRRLSTGFSLPTQKSIYSEGATLNDHNADDDYFGTAHLHRSITQKSSGSDLESFPKVYQGDSQGNNNDLGRYATAASLSYTADYDGPPQVTPVRRRSTVVDKIQSITTKFGFWDKDFHADRIKIIITFASNYVYLIVGFMIALCVYWGSYFNRASRYKNIKFLVVLADSQAGPLPPIFNEIVEAFFTTIPAIKATGNFKLMDLETISGLAQSHNHSVTAEVYRQIHHKKYYGAFYVKQNSTLDYFTALKTASKDFNPADSLLEAVYETGSDFNAVNNYIISIIGQINSGFLAFLPKSPLLSSLLKGLTPTEIENVFANAPQLMTSLPNFVNVDLIPVTNQIFTGILTIALIYIVIFSFFQFIFSVSVQTYIATKISGGRYIAFRMVVSQISYMILALSFVVLNTAFQIPFNKAFGRSGFLVIWAFCYLLMSSLGSFIEILGLFCVVVKPQLIGFVLLIVAVFNVAPVVSPIVLCPSFYKYGYAMPVHAAYDLMHVAYFNSWKGRVGLDIGILLIWTILSNIASPFMMIWMRNQIRKAKEAAAKAAAADGAVKSSEISTSSKDTSGDSDEHTQQEKIRDEQSQLVKKEVDVVEDQDD